MTINIQSYQIQKLKCYHLNFLFLFFFTDKNLYIKSHLIHMTMAQLMLDNLCGILFELYKKQTEKWHRTYCDSPPSNPRPIVP